MPSAEPMPDRRRPLRAPPAKPPKRQVPASIVYPESDGKPMAETPVHWRATVDFALPLMDRYAARPDAYVGSDMLMFWEEGDPDKRVSPDVFVAFGPAKEPERLEVTEYWQFDPTEDYLSPSLKGRRLNAEGTYEPIPLERREGQLSAFSEVLGLELRPEGHALRLFDPELGEFLPSHKEQARVIEAVKAERDAEAAARRAAKARIAELERQLAEADE